MTIRTLLFATATLTSFALSLGAAPNDNVALRSGLTPEQIAEIRPSLPVAEIEKIHRRIARRVAELQARHDSEVVVIDSSTTSTTSTTTTPAFTPAAGFAGLPAPKNGMFPPQMPTYNGVEQLLPISDTWVVVVTVNLDEVSQEIAKLVKADPAWATIDFLAAQQHWKDTLAAGTPDWYNRKRQIDPQVAKYCGQARLNIGEKNMDNLNYYSITSSDDPAYRDPQLPVAVTRFMAAMGDEQYPGLTPHYGLYSYLQLPAPMVDGKSYTITLQNGKSVSFSYDELTLVSRAVKTNQVGYLPDAKKYAYVGAFLQELPPLTLPNNTTFSVVNAATGQAVYSGPVNLRASNPRFAAGPNQTASTRPFVSGENIYEMDFSAVTRPGTYFITVSGVGRSWPFTIDRNALGEAFFTAARGMLHKRCGIELKKPYTPWLRIKCHATPVYESQYVPIFFEPLLDPAQWAIFDIVGATMDKSKSTADATGGWHDAGDWDKNLRSYANVFDLLAVFDMKPDNFQDGQLNIPESGNGIPDLLDEVEYGLLVWLKSQRDDGGVAGVLETSTHPDMTDPNFPYAYSQRTRWTSFMFAAAASWYARLVKPFNSTKSAQYQAAALKAFTFATNPKNSLGTITIHAKTNRGTGTPYDVSFTEHDFFNKPFEIAARTCLFLLTNDKSYMDPVNQLLTDVQTPYAINGVNVTLIPGQWPFSLRDCSLSLYYPLFNPAVAAVLPADVITKWKGYYTSLGDSLAKLNDAEFYRRSRALTDDLRMTWGSDVMTNQAKALIYAYHLTQDPKYKQAALLNVDYMLGGNATSMCWTTGIGFVYPNFIHDRVSAQDGILDPVPGIAIYGPNELDLVAFNIMWLPKDPAGQPIQMLRPQQYTGGKIILPRLRNWAPDHVLRVEMNEYTVWETMSSPILVLGYLMEPGYRAPSFLLNRLPRDPRVLFGQWYLP